MSDALPAWQNGFPIERLKDWAGVFKTAHKPLVFGAFGLVKERDVAAAMAAGALLVKREGERTTAAAILHRLRSGSTHNDFAGRPVRLPPGAVSISAFAALDQRSAVDLLLVAKQKAIAAGGVLWAEIFEEDPIARAAVDQVGLTYQATKIMAGSEIKGLYAIADDQQIADDPAEDATLLTLQKNFLTPLDLAAVKGELAAVDWAQHYSGYNKGKSWTAFALRGYDRADPTFIIKPAEMSQNWRLENPERMHAAVGDTAAYEKFPMTREIVNRIPGAKDRVRFMKLAPGGGELTRHADITDRDAGIKDGAVCRLHIPIITNARVSFQAWDKRGHHIERNFTEGGLCYLDQRKPHCVENAGDTERIHLVIDTRSSKALRKLIGEAVEQ